MTSPVGERSTATATILAAGAAGPTGPTSSSRPAGSSATSSAATAAGSSASSDDVLARVRRRRAGPRRGGRHAGARRRRRGRLRIGIAAGDVTWDDAECRGLPVVVAARCRPRRSSGEILVSDVVRLLAGDRAAGRCELIGPLASTASPIRQRRPGCSGRRRDRRADRPPAPAAPALAARTPAAHAFVGRSAALASLERAWGLAGAGGPDRAHRRRGRHRQDAAGDRVRPRSSTEPAPPCSSAAATTTSPSRTNRGCRPSTSCSPRSDRGDGRRAGIAARPAGPAARPRRACWRTITRRRWIPTRPATGSTRRSASRFARRRPAGRRSSCSTTCTGRARRRSPCCATSPGPGCRGRCSSSARSATPATSRPSRSPPASPTSAASTP